MKKRVVVLITFLALCVTAASGFAQDDWKTHVSEAIDSGGLEDSTMMEDALQFATSQGVPLSEFLTEVKANNPVAFEVALRASFAVVADKNAVIVAAFGADADVGLVVATAIAAGVPAGQIIVATLQTNAPPEEVIAAAVEAGADSKAVVSAALEAKVSASDVVAAAIEAGAPASDVVAAAVEFETTNSSQAIFAAITEGGDIVGVIGGAMAGGATMGEITSGATMAGLSPQIVAVAVETAETGQAYTPSRGQETQSGQQTQTRERTRERWGHVSPN